MLILTSQSLGCIVKGMVPTYSCAPPFLSFILFSHSLLSFRRQAGRAGKQADRHRQESPGRFRAGIMYTEQVGVGGQMNRSS